MSDTRSKMILEFEFNNKSKGALGKVAAEMKHVSEQSDDIGESVDRVAASENKLSKESKRVWGAESKALKDQITNVKALTDATNKLNAAQKAVKSVPPKPAGLGGGGMLGGGAPKAPPGMGLGGGGMLGRGKTPKPDDRTPAPNMAAMLAEEKKFAAELNAEKQKAAEADSARIAKEKAEHAEALEFKKALILKALNAEKNYSDFAQEHAQRQKSAQDGLNGDADAASKEKFIAGQFGAALASKPDEYEGMTDAVRVQRRELALLNEQLKSHKERLDAASKDDSLLASFKDQATGLKVLSDRVKEYEGYIKVTESTISQLIGTEKEAASLRAQMEAKVKGMAAQNQPKTVAPPSPVNEKVADEIIQDNKKIKSGFDGAAAAAANFMNMFMDAPVARNYLEDIGKSASHAAEDVKEVSEELEKVIDAEQQARMDKLNGRKGRAADERAKNEFDARNDMPDTSNMPDDDFWPEAAKSAKIVAVESKKIESNLDAAVDSFKDFKVAAEASGQSFNEMADKHEQSAEYAKQAAEHAERQPKNIRDVLMLEEKRIAKKKDYRAALRGEERILMEIKDLHEKSKAGDDAATAAMMKKSEELQSQQKLVRQLRFEHEGLRQDILNGERAHEGAARIISDLRESRKDDASNNGPPGDGGGPGGPGGPNDPNKKIAESSEKAKEAQKSLMGTIKSGWSSFGGFIGPFSAALQTGISAAWYLKQGLEFFRDGSLSAGIREATAAMGDLVDKQGIAAASGNVLSGREAAQAGMRGASLGLRGGDNAAAAQIAAVAANMKVLHGEATSLKEAMVETLNGVQQELAAGEIGENLKKAGVHSATYNQALAQEAARRGVLVESLDAQTKQQILLAHATNKTTDKLAALRNEGLEQAAQVDNYMNGVRERIGKMMVEAGGGAGGVDEAKKRLAYLEGQANSKGSVLQGTKEQNVTPEQLEQARADLDAAIAKQEAMRKQFAQDIIQQDADLFAGAAAQMGEDGVEQIQRVREGFDLVAQLSKLAEAREKINPWDDDALEANREQMREIEGLLSGGAVGARILKREFWDMAAANLSSKDALEAKAKFEAALVPKVAEDAKNKKMSLEFELKNNLQLDMISKRELAGKAAGLAIDEQVYDLAKARGMTYDQTQEILNSAEITRRKELATTKAQLAVQLTMGDNLTKIQKDWYTTLGTVQDVKFQANELTETTTEYRIQIGKAAGIQFFEKLGGHIGFSTEKLGGLAKMLGVVAGNLDDLTNGSILTDNFLGRIWSKVDKIDATKDGSGKGKGSGGKKDDDMLERLRRERIERQIADAAMLGDVTQEAYEHQKNFIEDNLKEVSAAYEATYGDMGAIDQTMRLQLARLEWQYAEGMKQAGDDAAEQKAIKGQLYDQLGVMQKEMEARNATFFTSLEEGLGRYASTAQVKLGEVSAAWQAHVKEYEVMQQLVADAQKDINARALDNVLVDEVMTSGPQRKLSDGEKGAVNARAEAAAQMKEVLSAHQWSADQKLVIEANYQAKLYEIEQSYNQARFDENQRIRDEMAASAQAALAETQELMSHFSDEARSMSESSQATFQGGLSNIGMKSAEGLDDMMAGMIGYIGILGEVDKAQTRLAMSEEQMTKANTNSAAIYAKGAAGIISASAKAADGVIKNEQWKAGIKGAVHTAESIGAFASEDYVGGTMHALAAAKFFVIAATASEAPPAKAKKAEATKRTALSQNTVALSRDRGMTAWTQVFIQLHPITGEAMVSTMNDSARRGNMTGRGIDSRLTRPTATVRTEV